MKRLATAILTGSALLGQSRISPIRLDDDNPHYFRYHGKATVLITSGEHYGAVINADFDQIKYLDALKRDGLNFTRLFGGSYVEVPGQSFGIHRNTLAPAAGKLILPWARSREPGYAGGGNRFDLNQWDEQYFARLHHFLAAAEEHGIVVEITLFSSQYADAQWKVSVFNSSNNVNHTTPVGWKSINTIDNGNLLVYQERYTRKLVQEVNPFPNVIFEIQNEPWSDHPSLARVVNPYLGLPGRDKYPNSVDLADDQSLAWQRRVAEWVANEETRLPNKHLIAQNLCNFGYPVSEPVPGVSVLNFHYAYPDAAIWNYGLNKALAYDESGFLGPTDEAYRRQAWNFMLSGGATFDGLDYSFSPAHEDGSDSAANGPGGGSPAFRAQLGILLRFLGALPFIEMRPDSKTVLQASKVQVHMLAGKGVYAAFLDGNGPTQLRLQLPEGVYTGEWINPETGARTPIPSFQSKGSAELETPVFQSGLAVRLALEDGHHKNWGGL